MAEVLGVVASCVSVLQLLGCVQQLRKFCKTVQDLPEDLKVTLDEIEVFRQVISQIGNNNREISLVVGSTLLQSTLDRCEAASSALHALTARIIEPLNKKSNLRPKHLLKAALKKHEIQEMKEKMDSARNMLHLTVTCYNTYDMAPIKAEGDMLKHRRLMHQETLRMQQDMLCLWKEGTFSPSPASDTLTNGLELAATKTRYSSFPRQSPEELCRLKKCCCACHDTIAIRTNFWSLKLSTTWFWKVCDRPSCRNSKNASIRVNLTPIGIQMAICLSLDLMFNSFESSISPSLSFQRVVAYSSPGFKLVEQLQTGSLMHLDTIICRIRELFDTGKASPRDIDPDGVTWLEVCNVADYHLEAFLTILRNY